MVFETEVNGHKIMLDAEPVVGGCLAYFIMVYPCGGNSLKYKI